MSTEKLVYPTHLSIRLYPDERKRIEQDAAGQALSAYARDALLGEQVEPRKIKTRAPIRNYAEATAFWSKFGRSGVPANINQLARHANMGNFDFDPEFRLVILGGFADIRRLRIIMDSDLSPHGWD